MKFYINLLVVIAVVAAVLYWLQSRQEAPAAPSAASPSTPPSQTSAVPAQSPIAVAPTPTGGSDSAPQITSAAQRARVKVVSISQQGGWQIVTVSASERNALGDFLDECMKVGMKDMKQDAGSYRQTVNAQGTTTYHDTYKLKF